MWLQIQWPGAGLALGVDNWVSWAHVLQREYHSTDQGFISSSLFSIQVASEANCCCCESGIPLFRYYPHQLRTTSQK